MMAIAPGRTRTWSSGRTLVGRLQRPKLTARQKSAGLKRRGTGRDTTPGEAMGAPKVRPLR